MAFELEGGEELLVKVSVNLFRGIEAIGRHIKITNLRVLFEQHALNIQKQLAKDLCCLYYPFHATTRGRCP
jgi:hypothetical protein